MIKIEKNDFFVYFKRKKDAINCHSKLNNYVIEEYKAQIISKICRLKCFDDPFKDDKLCLLKDEKFNNYVTYFIIELPDIKYYNVKDRIIGINNYNIKRIIEISNKEYFLGNLKIDLESEDKYIDNIYCEDLDMIRAKFSISSNNKDKFLSACKLFYELCICTYDEFKRFCFNNNYKYVHHFKIKRVDINTCNTELQFLN